MGDSSFIKSIDYNRINSTLDVTFEYKDVHGLRVYKSKYRYLGVPAAVASFFANATSKGNFYNKRIKGQFQNVKIYHAVENAE